MDKQRILLHLEQDLGNVDNLDAFVGEAEHWLDTIVWELNNNGLTREPDLNNELEDPEWAFVITEKGMDIYNACLERINKLMKEKFEESEVKLVWLNEPIAYE